MIMGPYARRALARVPADLDLWCSRNGGSTLDAALELQNLLQKVSWHCGYVTARNCGRSHKQAVRRANSMLRKARRNMGYSYPELGDIVV